MLGRYFNLDNPVSSHTLNDELAGWWMGLPQYSGSKWIDVIRGNDGDLTFESPATTDCTWSTPLVNSTLSAVNFSGNGQYVDCGDILSDVTDSTGYTVSMWVYATNLSGFRNFLGQGTTALKFGLITINTLLRAQFNSGGDFNIGTLSLNTPYHVVYTNNGSGVAGYLNGVQTGTSSARSATSSGGNPFTIGADDRNNRYTQGRIWDTRIWKRPLSEGEVWDLYTDALNDNIKTIRRINPRTYFLVNAVGGGFQPAWTRRSNTVVSYF